MFIIGHSLRGLMLLRIRWAYERTLTSRRMVPVPMPTSTRSMPFVLESRAIACAYFNPTIVIPLLSCLFLFVPVSQGTTNKDFEQDEFSGSGCIWRWWYQCQTDTCSDILDAAAHHYSGRECRTWTQLLRPHVLSSWQEWTGLLLWCAPPPVRSAYDS